jgi:hypothetical protein
MCLPTVLFAPLLKRVEAARDRSLGLMLPRPFAGRSLFQAVTLHARLAHTDRARTFGKRCSHSYPRSSQRENVVRFWQIAMLSGRIPPRFDRYQGQETVTIQSGQAQLEDGENAFALWPAPIGKIEIRSYFMRGGQYSCHAQSAPQKNRLLEPATMREIGMAWMT